MTVLAQLYFALLFFAFGASIGSFLAVVFERVPKGEPITGRSHCACGRQLKATENIPVIGWIKTGGRAKCCGAKLPARYLVFEIACGAIAAEVGLVILNMMI